MVMCWPVQQSDGGWLVFTAPERLWGLPWQEHTADLRRLSSGGVDRHHVSTIATRRLVRPIRKFPPWRYVFRHESSSSRQWRKRGRGSSPASSPHSNEMQAQIQKFVAYRTAMLCGDLARFAHAVDQDPPARRVHRGHTCSKSPAVPRCRGVAGNGRRRARAFFRGDADEGGRGEFRSRGRSCSTIANDYADQDIEIAYVRDLSHAVGRGRPRCAENGPSPT